MITFNDPDRWLLFLIIPAYILGTTIAFYYYRKKLRRLFGGELLQQLMKDRGLFKILLKKFLLVLALLNLIIALTDPRWGETQERKSRINSDLVLLVDVSSSMLVEDIQPNRLEKVKLKMKEIVNMQRGNRIGITIFAGSAFVYTPLTTDYSSLLNFIRNISTTMVSRQGTDLTLGLQTSLEAFMDNDSQKVLVAFTDGENHNQNYQEVVEDYVEKGITVFMIGVGSPNGEKIPLRNEEGEIVEYFRDSSGKFVISKLDYATLSDITQKTGGIYFPLTAEQDDILTISEFINRSQTRYEEGETKKTLKKRYQIFATLAFLLLLAEMLIGTSKSSSRSPKITSKK